MSDRRAVRPLPLLWLALACAAGFVATYLLLIRTHHGQRLDQGAFEGRALATPAARHAAHDLLTTISVGMLVVVVAVLLVQGLVRRRASLALLAATVIGGALLCTELLKELLWRPYLVPASPYENTFPSGHTTIGFAVGVAATLVAPPRLRRQVAVAAVLSGAGVGIATMAAGWHRPSDVAGALLVVVGWTAAVAVVSAVAFPGALSRERGWPRPARARNLLAIGAALLVAGYVAVLAVAVADRAGAIDWTLLDGAFAGACAAIAVLAAALMVALLTALRSALPIER